MLPVSNLVTYLSVQFWCFQGLENDIKKLTWLNSFIHTNIEMDPLKIIMNTVPHLVPLLKNQTGEHKE